MPFLQFRIQVVHIVNPSFQSWGRFYWSLFEVSVLHIVLKWEKYIEQEKKEQLNVIIKDENLKPAETDAFMQRAFADGFVTETGTGIAKILPPSNPFLPESDEKKQTEYTAEPSLLCKVVM